MEHNSLSTLIRWGCKIGTNFNKIGTNFYYDLKFIKDDAHPKEPNDDFNLFHIHNEKPEPSIMVPVKVNGQNVSMELDTGASVSVMSEEAWGRRFPKVPWKESQIMLKTYTGEALEIIGQALVEVTYQDQTTKLPLQILKGNGLNLFGRNWLKNIRLNWGSTKKISCDLDSVLSRHQSVSKDELGTMQGVKAKFFVKPESKPAFSNHAKFRVLEKKPLNKN